MALNIYKNKYEEVVHCAKVEHLSFEQTDLMDAFQEAVERASTAAGETKHDREVVYWIGEYMAIWHLIGSPSRDYLVHNSSYPINQALSSTSRDIYTVLFQGLAGPGRKKKNRTEPTSNHPSSCVDMPSLALHRNRGKYRDQAIMHQGCLAHSHLYNSGYPSPSSRIVTAVA